MTPDSIRAIADTFRDRYRPGRVRGLLVAGSGLSLEVPGWEAGEPIELVEIFEFPMHELLGHSQTLTLWRRGDETLMVMNGRFHLYQGYRPEEVVAPIRLAGLLGAEILIATNASGALDPTMAPGSLVVVNDHINLLGSNPLVGDWGRDFGPPFPDMSAAYDPELRRLAMDAAGDAGFDAREGVYCAMLGSVVRDPGRDPDAHCPRRHRGRDVDGPRSHRRATDGDAGLCALPRRQPCSRARRSRADASRGDG